MIEVTAAIDGEGPNLFSQICAARSIGSNGSSSGLPTSTRYVVRQRPAPGRSRCPRRRGRMLAATPEQQRLSLAAAAAQPGGAQSAAAAAQLVAQLQREPGA